MEATSGFFQKCQQYLNFRGSNSNGGGKISQNYQVGSEDSDIEDNEQYDEDSNNDQSLSSRFTPFQRSYQKVSTEDKTTKYSDSYQNLGDRSNDDFYDASSTNNSKRKDSEDWGWGEDSGWSDVKSSSSIDKTSKKTTTSSSSTVGGLAAKKKSEKSKNEPAEPANLLIDFGGASSAAEKKNTTKTEGESWANWENDAWESLSK